MRKRKNKESIDEISQGLLIKQKNGKLFFQKQNQKIKKKIKTKVKVEIKTNKTAKSTKRNKKLKHQNKKEKMKLILMKQ